MILDQLIGNGLSLERLRAFLSVMEKGSIRGVAPGEATRQSQMSRQITELEKTLGIKLFERRNRQMLPTVRGGELAVLVKAFFAGLGDMIEQPKSERTNLQVAGGESAFEQFGWPIFEQLQQRFGGVCFEFSGTSTKEAIARISDGRSDLALVREEELDDRHYFKTLGEMPLYIAVHQSTLSHGETLGFKKLKNHEIPFLRHGDTMLKCLEEIARQHQFRLRIGVKADSYRQAYELLRGGGVKAAILPRHLAESLPGKHFVISAFDKKFNLTRRIALACDKRAASVRSLLTKAVDAWMDVVRHSNGHAAKVV